MRIARFRSSLDAVDGGIFTAVIASSAALADEHDIAIAARRIAGDPAGLHTRSRARIVALPASLAGHLRATNRLVAGADLVTLEGPWDPWNPLTAAACVARRTPYLCVAHGSWSQFVKDRYPAKHFKKLLWWGLVEHWVVRGGAGIWWTTEREKRSSIGTFPGIPDRDPVVELATEDLRGDRGTAPRDPGALQMVTLTRIHPLKRLDDLVRAVAGLAAAPYGLRVHLTIVGDGPPEVIAGLTALAADLGVADRITRTGRLWGDARIAPLAAADIYVCPGPESLRDGRGRGPLGEPARRRLRRGRPRRRDRGGRGGSRVPVCRRPRPHRGPRPGGGRRRRFWLRDCAPAAEGAALQPSGLPAAIFRVRTHSTPVGIFGR